MLREGFVTWILIVYYSIRIKVIMGSTKSIPNNDVRLEPGAQISTFWRICTMNNNSSNNNNSNHENANKSTMDVIYTIAHIVECIFRHL